MSPCQWELEFKTSLFYIVFTKIKKKKYLKSINVFVFFFIFKHLKYDKNVYIIIILIERTSTNLNSLLQKYWYKNIILLCTSVSTVGGISRGGLTDFSLPLICIPIPCKIYKNINHLKTWNVKT